MRAAHQLRADAAVRPRARAGAARRAPRARAGRAPRALRHAPHRLGRLVDGRPGARGGGALRGRGRGSAGGAARAADPVRRLRGLAARLAAGRDARPPGRLLAPRARRPARGARAALDRPRPAVQSYRGAVRRVLLSPGLSAALEPCARRQGATLFMVLLAGFQALLARYAGSQDLAFGTPVAPYTRGDRAAIGLFINTLVRARGSLRTSPSPA